MAAELTPLEQRMLDALFPPGDARREPVLAALNGDLSFREPVKNDLVDRYLSRQWCMENLVLPLEELPEDGVLIAIGNVSYLATIGDFIRHRFQGRKCQFVEMPADELLRRLNES
ncbi:MAG: hypothetical protein VKK03_02425 [Synechococcus sp.]|nr:hypothetical protein [Synechococcus sp.]